MRHTSIVTGGAGFIGSHLCDLLTQKDHKVICVDNLQTGSTENISHLSNNENFKFMEHDVESPLSIGNEKIDFVFNLACPAAPIHYRANPLKTVRTNTIGVLNVLELAKKHNARVLQASTSEIYGDPLIHPQKESYWGNVNPIGPRACYDEGKRIAEVMFTEYRNEHNLDVRIARIFNTYGPRMATNDGRVMPNFITQALNGENLTVYGDGSQTRSFCYVSDLIAGLYKLMMSETCIGPVNLGNPHEITINDLTRTILSLTGSSSEIVHIDLPKDDPTRRKPDIAKARKELDWSPEIKLEEGLKLTINYFRNPGARNKS